MAPSQVWTVRKGWCVYVLVVLAESQSALNNSDWSGDLKLEQLSPGPSRDIKIYYESRSLYCS